MLSSLPLKWKDFFLPPLLRNSPLSKARNIGWPESGKFTEVYGGGSGGRGLPRLGGNAPMQHILHTSAAYQTEIREDLTIHPEESRRGERHAEEYPLHDCGHLRSLRWVSVTVTGDLDEGRIGGFERPDAILFQIYGMLESAAKDSCSDCPTTRRPLAARRSFSIHRMAQESGCARGSKEATHGVCLCSGCPSLALDQTSLRWDKPFKSGNKDRGAKAQGPKKAGQILTGSFMMLARLFLATVHGSSRDTKVGGPCFFALMSSFSRETEFTKFVSEEIATARSRHASTRRRIPMPASPRHRARCNRHEARAGDCRPRTVLSRTAQHWRFGPSWWDCLTQRRIRRGAGSASRIRWPTVVISAAAAKLCFMLCSTEHWSQIQNKSDFRATQRTGPAVKPLPSRPQKRSSALVSACPLVLPLYRCSISFPHAWRMIFVILRTPTRLLTTPHSFLWPSSNGAHVVAECNAVNWTVYWHQTSSRSDRCCEGRKSWHVHWRHAHWTAVKKHRSRALAFLPTAPTYHSAKIRDGTNYNSRCSRLFFTWTFTCDETCDRSSHSSKLTWTFGRKLGCRWHGWNWNWKLGFARSP